jgi:hypothetical protein
MNNTYKIIFRQSVSATSDLFEEDDGVVEVYYCRSSYKDIYKWALEYISAMGAHGVTTHDLEIVASDIPEYIESNYPQRSIINL